MGKHDRSWDEMVRRIEAELSERGPSATDDRKVRFLIAAYLRDIRDRLAKPTAGVKAPAPRSSWDVEVSDAHEDGDTRPFAFADVPAGKAEKKGEATPENKDDDA